MSALLQALISRFGEPVARKLLGIEKQEQNPKYAINIGGINLNPMNMLKRAGINQGIKSLMGGNMSSLMGPAALLGGAVMLGRAFDPTRPGSRNYNPNLSGQIDYLSGISGMIGRNPSSGLMQYGPESVLRGQNVMSMFGTNDYEDQLGNFITKMTNRKNLSTFQQKQLDKARDEMGKEMERQQTEVASRARAANPNVYASADKEGFTSGGGGFASQNTGTNEGFSNRSGRGRTGYNKGGIASLWQK